MTELPPGPKDAPLIQVLRWIFDPVRYMEQNAALHGDTFTARFPDRTIVFTRDTALVKDVFSGDPDALWAGVGNAILKPVVGERSLLLADGPRHRRSRKLMMPPFHGERMKAYGETMRWAAQRRAETWSAGGRVRVLDEAQAISLDVIMEAVLGLEAGPEAAALRGRLHRLMAMTASPTRMLVSLMLYTPEGESKLTRLLDALGPLTPWGRMRALLSEIHALLIEHIRRRREKPGEDVLSLLCASGMDEDELRDQAMTLLVAGHETSATALSWLFWELRRAPEARVKLLAELDEAFPSGRVDPAQAAALPYLSAAVNEALRLHPVAPIVWRRLMEPVRLGGRDWPRGVGLAPCAHLTHRRADLYPDPDAFKPERFLEKAFHPWEHFPFGGGGRRCIGLAFALHELKIVAAQLLRHWEFVPAPGYEGRSARRAILLAPEGGLPATARRR